MGVRSALRRVAAGGPVPVFVARGAGGGAVADLPLADGVQVVDSPRAATVLLVSGAIPRTLLHPIMAIHDQLPVPRATVWWRPDAGNGTDLAEVIPGVVPTAPGDTNTLRRVFAALVAQSRLSEPPALADIDRAQWRGVGPYGHGGTGMTGGVPFGRPMPETSPDRDGLKLDALSVRLGPFLPGFPPGLAVDLVLQGDVIQEATVAENPFRFEPPPPSGPFAAALTEPVPVADLELARASHHLHRAATVLHVAGLAAEGRRCLAEARFPTAADGPVVDLLADRLGRRRSLRWRLAGVATLGAADAPPGSAARAGGVAADARSDDPAYAGLGFEPVTHTDGDAWARFLQRLAEAGQAVALAERAGTRVREPGPVLEGGCGPLPSRDIDPTERLLQRLPDLLVGQEWGDAVTTVASLDLDLESLRVSPQQGWQDTHESPATGDRACDPTPEVGAHARTGSDRGLAR